ncbi:MAG: hypothetical protein IJI45_11315 [Anaerolineaceae bacterium]|nr:hypothetical protein [Anaerolineaceae bacterium]
MRNYTISSITTTKEKKALVKELVENLRDVDRREMECMGFTTLQGAEVSIYETSPVYEARTKDTGKLIAVWGLQILIGKKKNTFIIWALGTEELNKYRKSFVKESSAIINRWVELYGELRNTVACFNKRAIAWLKWQGAEFSKPRKFNGEDYVDFVIRRKRDKNV